MNIENFDCTVNRSSLYQIVADRLEEMIINDISDEDKTLPSEQVLATGFNVSRPVIREALKILNERGLIRQTQGGRTTVSLPTTQHIKNPLYRIMQMQNMDPNVLFEIRICLEKLSARKAAENVTNSDIKKLYDLIDNMSSTAASDQYAKYDFAFHKTIAEIGGNPILNIFIESISEIMTEMITSSISNQKDVENGIFYHKRIVDAIANHNPDHAEKLMCEHITLFMRNYEKAIT